MQFGNTYEVFHMCHGEENIASSCMACHMNPLALLLAECYKVSHSICFICF